MERVDSTRENDSALRNILEEISVQTDISTQIASDTEPFTNQLPDDDTDGRKSVYHGKVMTASMKKKLILKELPKHHGIIQRAIDALRVKGYPISKAWYYREYNKDAAFAAKCDETFKLTLSMVESKLFELIEGNNAQAVIFFLKSRNKDYKPSMNMDIVSMTTLTKEQKEAIINEIRNN